MRTSPALTPEHDARRFINRNGWDAYSPPGTYARLDRHAAQHAHIDRMITPYSVKPNFRGVGALPVPLTPVGDGVTRMELEEELLSVRAMRHVYRVKRNLTKQQCIAAASQTLAIWSCFERPEPY